MRVDAPQIYIDTQAELDALVAEASAAPWIALDTEFERVRTFFPRLCLLQIATPERAACIDPLGDISLAGVNALLSSGAPLKIFHAARQDLEVLQHALDVLPDVLFDTQIAAALCGYGEQVGYAQLVKEICGVELSKAYTRTTWCRRPLQEQEICYALDDVHYLGDLYRHLSERLEQHGRTGWAEEDCAVLARGETIESGAASAVNRVLRACHSLDQAGQSVAHALALWRERAARRRDRPREWLLGLDTIVEIARHRPSNLSQLGQLAGVEASTVTHRGQEILDAIEQGRAGAQDYTPLQRSVRPDPAVKALGNRLWKHLGELCMQAGLPTASVARRDDIRALAAGERDLRLLQGWRREFAGNTLLDLAERAGEEPAC